ncbi:MAG: 50S ribosomal protein L23 [Candidatus Omnitrophica bacterium]|nr:50S ribosomal protein L23 [Candidatus Omnitrophota bacterium]
MQNSYKTINSLIRTEKGTNMLPDSKYLFWVDKNANKISIKTAVEEIYKVKVKEVNTLTMRGKKKRVRYILGKTPDWKKAIVTLKQGEKIDVT